MNAHFSLDFGQLESAHRIDSWIRSTAEVFPEIRLAQVARSGRNWRIEALDLGPGTLWSVTAPGQAVQGEARVGANLKRFVLFVQIEGTTMAYQDGRQCRLRPGDMALTDPAKPFRFRSAVLSKILIFAFPKAVARQSIARLMEKTALVFDRHDPTVSIVFSMLHALSCNGLRLSADQRCQLFDALLSALAALPDPAQKLEADIPQRVQRALEDIDLLLEVEDMSPLMIAKRSSVSRRHLDMLFKRHIGMSIAERILEARLNQAATDLTSREVLRISDVAFSAGFRSVAHFSRSFKKRFGVSPKYWRMETSVHGLKNGSAIP